jgi:hypothetical protein
MVQRLIRYWSQEKNRDSLSKCFHDHPVNYLYQAHLISQLYIDIFSPLIQTFMKNQLVWALSLFIFFIACKAETPKEDTDVMVTSKDTTTVVAPVEFTDPKYSEILKATLANLSNGNIPEFMSTFADNAVYAFNTGDSLAGKAAINEYWVKRRAEVLDSLTFENQIFLPIKVNTPQSVEQKGIWVLAWSETTAKYKPSGKSMTQWIHNDVHFNDNDKIDRWITYSDRAVINAAMAK